MVTRQVHLLRREVPVVVSPDPGTEGGSLLLPEVGVLPRPPQVQLVLCAAGQVRPEGGEAEDGRLEGVELEEVPHTPHLGGVVVVGGQRVQVRVNMGLHPPCSSA